jgi:hypothetical protein
VGSIRNTARSFTKPEFNQVESKRVCWYSEIWFLGLWPNVRCLVVSIHRTADESTQVAADFAGRIVPIWKTELGPELLGAYLIGSLAHGGFSRRYSDIDIAVITEAGLLGIIGVVAFFARRRFPLPGKD